MKIERLRSTALRVVLHPVELSALVAAARWAADGAEGELPPQARDQVRQVLASYDAEMEALQGREST